VLTDSLTRNDCRNVTALQEGVGASGPPGESTFRVITVSKTAAPASPTGTSLGRSRFSQSRN